MNTFFYAANSFQCEEQCNYLTCGKRCLAQLKTVDELSTLKVLPGGSSFRTPSSMELRSGDLIILYAEKNSDIDTLLTLKDFFETFKIILIVGEEQITRFGRHYLLNPRYTAAIGENLDQLSAVISKMTATSSNTKQTYSRQECNYA